MEKIKVIDMIRQIRDKSYNLTKDMSEKELIAYFHQNAQKINSELMKSQKKQLQVSL